MVISPNKHGNTMSWVPVEDLDHTNCRVISTRFIKNISKKLKQANVVDPNCPLIIEAFLHIEMPTKYRRSRRRWRSSSRKTVSCGAGNQIALGDRRVLPYYCSSNHRAIFVVNGELYLKTKNHIRQFKNDWLLTRIMKTLVS